MATFVPGENAKLVDTIVMDIEAVVREADQGAAEMGRDSISVKVKVTSLQESPRILVEPRRFRLDADGRRVSARPTAMREPSLASTYLQAGQSVLGWLTFEPPLESKQFILETDLHRPPLTVSFSLGGSNGSSE